MTRIEVSWGELRWAEGVGSWSWVKYPKPFNSTQIVYRGWLFTTTKFTSRCIPTISTQLNSTPLTSAVGGLNTPEFNLFVWYLIVTFVVVIVFAADVVFSCCCFLLMLLFLLVMLICFLIQTVLAVDVSFVFLRLTIRLFARYFSSDCLSFGVSIMT